MSKVKIQGNASGTGVVTLTAPNTNTDRTITLPDSTGSILDSTSTLDATKLSGALPAIDGSALTNLPGGGKVLQVVSTTSTTVFSTTSSTLTDTGISLAITPSSTSSKVLVVIHASVGGDASVPAIAILRNTTVIGSGSDDGSRRGAASSAAVGADNITPITVSSLDSPSTTSATTYKLALSSRGDVSRASYTNRTYNDVNAGYTVRPATTITLMEIGA